MFHFKQITFCVIGKALFGNREFQTAKAKPGTRQLARLGVFFAMALRGATNRGATGSRLLPFRSARKVKMKWLTLVFAIACSALLCSCKPPPISGQLFVTDGSGIAKSLSGVEILLVDAKEADDFVNVKKEEAQKQIGALKEQIDQLKIQGDAAQAEYEKVKATNADYIASESYTNDARFVALENESSNELQKMQTFVNTIVTLRSKYGAPPPFMTSRYSQQQIDAFSAQKQDAQTVQTLRQQIIRVGSELGSLAQKIKNEKELQNSDEKGKVASIEVKIKQANNSLASFQKARFYFGGFSPKAIEISLTDGSGNFTINQPRPGTKIFAMIKSDDLKSEYFWLVDLPDKNQKLILSDANSFKVSGSH